MFKVINKKNDKIVKELKSEVEVSMYLATGEWELIPEKKSKLLSEKKDNK